MAGLLSRNTGQNVDVAIARQALQKTFGSSWPAGGFFSSALLLLKGGDKDRAMERFMEAAANFELLGVNIPLESIHWIMGVNRQVQLGNRIGRPIDGVIRGLLLAHKFGIGQIGANTARAIILKCSKVLDFSKPQNSAYH